jgi:hypothetical protein
MRLFEICCYLRKRVIRYSEASAIEPKGRGVLDTPLEPVIGLVEGETRWRGMTTFGDGDAAEQRGANPGNLVLAAFERRWPPYDQNGGRSGARRALSPWRALSSVAK